MNDLTLSKEDRRAVDLLLDRSARAAAGTGGNGNGKGHAVYASADPTLGQRIARTQRLLQLLELMPSGDPPADLVPRTLRFVEQFANQPAVLRAPQQVPHLINSQRPHA
jgi:hypothetical protein